MWCPEIGTGSASNLCTLFKLTTLVLTGCYKLTETDLASLAKLQKLKSLELSWCKKSPAFINDLRQKMLNTYINAGEFRVILSNIIDPLNQGPQSWELTDEVFWHNCINYQSSDL